MTTSASVDAIVVGAGVIGSSIALQLARSGRDVLVIDKAGAAGHGSTSASSAIIRFSYSTRDSVALAWEGMHCWQSWRAHLGDAFAEGQPVARFHRTGMVMLDVPVAPVDRQLALYDEVGVPYERWDAAELKRRLPDIDTGAYWPPKRIDDLAFEADASSSLGAVWTPDAGFVDDPQLAAQNLASAAEVAGARFRFGLAVTAVRQEAGQVRAVDLSDGTQVSASVVVNAAGPWSGRLNALAGVGGDWRVGVRPLRQEVHQLPAPPGYNSGGIGPVVADLDLGTYMRGAPGDALLVGGTEPECDRLAWVEDVDRVDSRATAEVYAAQTTRAARRLTTLTIPPRPRGVVGVYDVASDWSPIYDRTELEGFFVAIGTSGNQFKNAPVVGQLMETLITAISSGHDHDAQPVEVPLPHTGARLNLAAFSRLRSKNKASSGTVMG